MEKADDRGSAGYEPPRAFLGLAQGKLYGLQFPDQFHDPGATVVRGAGRQNAHGDSKGG